MPFFVLQFSIFSSFFFAQNYLFSCTWNLSKTAKEKKKIIYLALASCQYFNRKCIFFLFTIFCLFFHIFLLFLFFLHFNDEERFTFSHFSFYFGFCSYLFGTKYKQIEIYQGYLMRLNKRNMQESCWKKFKEMKLVW